jgi:creatinine amidohydrolase
MHWAKLRRGQVDALDRRTPVILPVAAVEQHGEHLPLGTDSMITEAVCDRLDQALDRRLIILPTQQVGCSEHHMAFVGSLTLSHETFRRAVFDVAESVIRHGFTRLLVLNGHGGNQAINGVIGEQIGQRFAHVECLVANWWTAAAKRLKPLQEGPFGSVGHACEFETSVLLAIAPELVDMTQARDDGMQHRVASLAFDMFRAPAASCYRPFDKLSHNGVFGMPSLASAEKGLQVLQETVASLAELITNFWELGKPPR